MIGITLIIIGKNRALTNDTGFYLFVAAILVSGLTLRRIARLAQAAAEGGRDRSPGAWRPPLTRI